MCTYVSGFRLSVGGVSPKTTREGDVNGSQREFNFMSLGKKGGFGLRGFAVMSEEDLRSDGTTPVFIRCSHFSRFPPRADMHFRCSLV